MKGKIAGVAIKIGSKVHVMDAPSRHHNIIHSLARQGISIEDRVEGFVLEDGTFLNRRDAESYGRKIGQINGKLHGTILTSEDLW
jgi:hypothetical protein